MVVLLLGWSFVQIVLGVHVFGIYKDYSCSVHLGRYPCSCGLTTGNEFVLCFLRANLFCICSIITDQVYGMQAFEASFNILLAFNCLLQFDLRVQYYQSDPKPSN